MAWFIVCQNRYKNDAVTNLPSSRLDAIITTEKKAPENKDERPKIEKKAAQAAMENAEKPTTYLNSWLLLISFGIISFWLSLAFFLALPLAQPFYLRYPWNISQIYRILIQVFF
tara:strand:- start:113 stop:454 length:342 start_codon:yes stop_codon:yes gene_type:complete